MASIGTGQWQGPWVDDLVPRHVVAEALARRKRAVRVLHFGDQSHLLVVKAQTVIAAVALMQLRHDHIRQCEVVNGLALTRYTFELDRRDVVAGRDIAQRPGQTGIQAQLHCHRRERRPAPRERGADVEIKAVDLEPAHMVLVRRAAIEPINQQKVLRRRRNLADRCPHTRGRHARVGTGRRHVVAEALARRAIRVLGGQRHLPIGEGQAVVGPIAVVRARDVHIAKRQVVDGGGVRASGDAFDPDRLNIRAQGRILEHAGHAIAQAQLHRHRRERRPAPRERGADVEIKAVDLEPAHMVLVRRAAIEPINQQKVLRRRRNLADRCPHTRGRHARVGTGRRHVVAEALARRAIRVLGGQRHLPIGEGQAVVGPIAVVRARDVHIAKRQVVDGGGVRASGDAFDPDRLNIRAQGRILEHAGHAIAQAQLHRHRRERRPAPRERGADVEIKAVDLEPAHMVLVRRAAIEPINQQKVLRRRRNLADRCPHTRGRHARVGTGRRHVVAEALARRAIRVLGGQRHLPIGEGQAVVGPIAVVRARDVHIAKRQVVDGGGVRASGDAFDPDRLNIRAQGRILEHAGHAIAQAQLHRHRRERRPAPRERGADVEIKAVDLEPAHMVLVRRAAIEPINQQKVLRRRRNLADRCPHTRGRHARVGTGRRHVVAEALARRAIRVLGGQRHLPIGEGQAVVGPIAVVRARDVHIAKRQVVDGGGVRASGDAFDPDRLNIRAQGRILEHAGHAIAQAQLHRHRRERRPAPRERGADVEIKAVDLEPAHMVLVRRAAIEPINQQKVLRRRRNLADRCPHTRGRHARVGTGRRHVVAEALARRAIRVLGGQRHLPIGEGQAVVGPIAVVRARDVHIAKRQVVDGGGVRASGDAFDPDRLNIRAQGRILEHAGHAIAQAQLHRHRRERRPAPRERGADVEIKAVDLEPAHMVLVRRAAIEPINQQKILRGGRACRQGNPLDNLKRRLGDNTAKFDSCLKTSFTMQLFL